MNTQFKIDRDALEGTITVSELDDKDTVSGTGAFVSADLLRQFNTRGINRGDLDGVIAALEAEELRQRNWQVTVDAMEAAERAELPPYGTAQKTIPAFP